MPRHLILIGLPGSGKSTIGQLVAEQLPAQLIDIDILLVREMGMPVAQIFGMVGETKFRQMERDAVRTARAREACVIVPGGGWAAQPGELSAAKGDATVVYLKCQPGTAVKRSEKGEVRPLLAGTDPLQRMKALLAEREPYYRLADHEVSTESRAAAEVAREVAQLARRHAGW